MCYVSKRVMRSRVGQLRCLARLYVWHRLGTDEGTRVTDDTLCRQLVDQTARVPKGREEKSCRQKRMFNNLAGRRPPLGHASRVRPSPRSSCTSSTLVTFVSHLAPRRRPPSKLPLPPRHPRRICIRISNFAKCVFLLISILQNVYFY